MTLPYTVNDEDAVLWLYGEMCRCVCENACVGCSCSCKCVVVCRFTLYTQIFSTWQFVENIKDLTSFLLLRSFILSAI